MGAFATELTEPILLPFDPPHSVTIRSLTGAEFDRAADPLDVVILRYQRKGAIQIAEEGGDPSKDAERVEAVSRELRADPLNLFNPHRVVAAGLIGWSYPKKERPFAPREVANLGPEAVEFIAREILKLTRPSLFETDVESEARQKND